MPFSKSANSIRVHGSISVNVPLGAGSFTNGGISYAIQSLEHYPF